MKPVLFEESQKNVYIIVIIPAVLTSLLFGILAIVQIVFHKPIGNHPAPISTLVVICLLSITRIIVFRVQNLKLKIYQDKIRVTFGLFACPKTVQIQDVKNVKLRKYDGLSEFLGWGVKFNNKNNERCYTVQEILVLN